ncbi:MAG: FGLLP motif-containing membrane protein [Acidimicrobiales bacterium]
MSRRGVVTAILGVLLLLILAAAGGMPASGNEPEGQGTTLNVQPSDDLPLSVIVKVSGTGFVPDVSIPVVIIQQCVPQQEACGPPTQVTPNGDGTFSVNLVVVRYLSLSDTTVDCAAPGVVCEVWADDGRGRHSLSFSQVVPTTTTLKPAPTTTAPPPTTTTRPAPSTTRDLRPQPGATIPPTTRVMVPPTTTTVPPATTSTSTTTTTLPPPPPAGDGASLVAVTSKNEPAGPPGGGLRVQGGGYSCPTVYFFFDGVRVGSGSPDAAGRVGRSGLSVPGDAGTGTHRVTSSCDPSGATIEQASLFEVLAVSVHRPALVTSLPLPSQVSLDPGVLLASAALAAGAIALIAFPYELFNSTMEENYDEVRGWFGMGPRGVPDVKTRSRALGFFALVGITALATGFLSPDFGPNRTSVVLFLGICVALLVMAVLFSLPADIGIRRQFGEWGKLNFLPGSVIVTIVMVAACRIFDFQPGFFYGALAALAFRSALSEEVQGKMTAANWLFSLVISLGAFFLRVPVSAAAAASGSSIWWIGVEICLSLIFLWGIEGLAVGMMPMRFLDGRKVFRWNRPAWAALFFVGVFATVHVLLRPGSGYVGSTSGEVGVGVMVLFVLFGLGSVAFWAYFRFRPQRRVHSRALA